MRKKTALNSEFELYKAIVHGRLRPFLPKFSDEAYIKKLIENSGIILRTAVNQDILNKIEETDLSQFGFQAGDEILLKLQEETGENRLTAVLEKVDFPELEELIDIDIPPAPDLKAEYFLRLIEDEFARMQSLSKKILESASDEEQLSLYANKNVQIAKDLGIETHTLFRKLDNTNINNSNAFILRILKLYIIRSILYLQFLFKPYLKESSETEETLRYALYGETPIRLNDRVRALENRSSMIQSKKRELRHVFLCHASEDKRDVVEVLARKFAESQISCWYDQGEILWGDSLIDKVNEGIKLSKYVLVVLSKNFVGKSWPNRELEASLNIEIVDGKTKVLHLIVGSELEEKEILLQYPILSNKKYLKWSDGVEFIVEKLKERVFFECAGNT